MLSKRMKLLVRSSAESSIGCDQASTFVYGTKPVEILSFDFSMSIVSVPSVVWVTIVTPGFGGIHSFSFVRCSSKNSWQ
ncbi:hypothetical protein OPV22_009154 [Ensete ventricosum]|uniref:Uncharacterized protein n=1 Tax=Ensete ventricosum TaxID=4639 RepID=A0AAV8RIJ6_ENSVE|nr:hypothetical protein OPV22_009154 [Ensete ventricosum]